MRSATTESFCRAELERHIEEMIALLDMLDSDPDLEDGGDTEANGDEADFSGYTEELPTCHWSGDGTAQAHHMICASPAASQRADEFADMPSPPVIYDFRGMRRR